MNVDFKNAADRHYRDGELLYQHSRWANADQLYGLSAECVLKRIIVGLDANSVDQATGDFTNRSPHRKHFQQDPSKDLWNYFSINFSGRLASHYALPQTSGFSDWDIFHRYAHECHFDQQRVGSHRMATIALQSLLQELFTDGVIQ